MLWALSRWGRYRGERALFLSKRRFFGENVAVRPRVNGTRMARKGQLRARTRLLYVYICPGYLVTPSLKVAQPRDHERAVVGATWCQRPQAWPVKIGSTPECFMANTRSFAILSADNKML